MAISGPPPTPNMGSHTSVAVTALMTVFNARLGWWIQNPEVRRLARPRASRLGPPLIHELLGRTDAAHKYVHLSDGGHFENLGVYELVRRRCRYIVAATPAGSQGILRGSCPFDPSLPDRLRRPDRYRHGCPAANG